MEPLQPRITKSTAVAAIKARFPTEEALLARFEVAKAHANAWDGERDGLREAVKTLPPGQYGNIVLSWSTTSPVVYVNTNGKHQLENCIQTTIPVQRTEDAIILLQAGYTNPEQLLDGILHALQTSKQAALEHVARMWVDYGTVVPNNELYDKKGAEKSNIMVLP